MDKTPDSAVKAFELNGEDEIIVHRARKDGQPVEFAITLNQLADFILDRVTDALVTENGESLETYSSHKQAWLRVLTGETPKVPGV